MRLFLAAAVAILVAPSAHAQNIFQMNAAVQQQYNNAYQSAWPVYAPTYYARPYRPLYRGGYLDDFDRRQIAIESQQQTLEMRRMNRTLQFMEWDLRDAARRR